MQGMLFIQRGSEMREAGSEENITRIPRVPRMAGISLLRRECPAPDTLAVGRLRPTGLKKNILAGDKFRR